MWKNQRGTGNQRYGVWPLKASKQARPPVALEVLDARASNTACQCTRYCELVMCNETVMSSYEQITERVFREVSTESLIIAANCLPLQFCNQQSTEFS